jgi:hypothetical protein
MCTMIARQIKINGSGKGGSDWFKLKEANVSYDHPFDAPFVYALNIDFVNEGLGPGARVAVELSLETAQAMVATILGVLKEAEEGGFLQETAQS